MGANLPLNPLVESISTTRQGADGEGQIVDVREGRLPTRSGGKWQGFKWLGPLPIGYQCGIKPEQEPQ